MDCDRSNRCLQQQSEQKKHFIHRPNPFFQMASHAAAPGPYWCGPNSLFAQNLTVSTTNFPNTP